jgi:glycosyltransferase involved in cell wall biosynthesis
MIAGRPILISTPVKGSRKPKLGTAHYSYGFAAQNFVRMFEDNGVPVVTIDSPEQYKNAAFATANGLEWAEHIHLIFRSTEDIRPIPSAYNIACFAWEFDRLKQDGLPEEPIQRDQVRMLRSCDEVWTPCHYTQGVLRSHGINASHVIPAPIRAPAEQVKRRGIGQLAELESTPLVTTSAGNEEAFVRLAKIHTDRLGNRPELQRAIDAGRVFLTVCNPYDKRKNLASLIEGYLMATAGVEDSVLLIKLVTSGMFESPAGYLFHQMRVIFGNPHCLDEKRVILFSAFLDDDEMAQLYGSADFYASATIAEGQNLPLLEAMAHGCIPVSARHTAMADYIDDDNAVVMQSSRFRGLVPQLASDVAQSRIEVDFSDRFQVAEAITAALALNPEERAAKAAAARATAIDRYGDAAVFRMVEHRIGAARPDMAPTPAIDAEAKTRPWWKI